MLFRSDFSSEMETHSEQSQKPGCLDQGPAEQLLLLVSVAGHELHASGGVGLPGASEEMAGPPSSSSLRSQHSLTSRVGNGLVNRRASSHHIVSAFRTLRCLQKQHFVLVLCIPASEQDTLKDHC